MPLWLGQGILFLYRYLDNKVFRNIIIIIIIIIISSIKGVGGNWNHLNIIQHRSGKARNQRAIENSYIGHCIQTAGSADIKVSNCQHGK